MTLFIPTSDLLIFKTNIETEEDMAVVAHAFELESGIRKWNVDRQDVDHVLRVEGENLDSSLLMRCLEDVGFTCTELTD